MLARHDPSVDLLALAARQAGVVSTEQPAGHGLPRHSVERLVRQGHWQRLDRSVYLTSSVPPCWTALAWAGVLLGGDRARLGGSTAGFPSWPVAAGTVSSRAAAVARSRSERRSRT